jgi:hypothetical protein
MWAAGISVKKADSRSCSLSSSNLPSEISPVFLPVIRD